MDTVTNPENQIVTRKPSLLTAAMIADNCPDKLADLGKRITVHLEKAAQCDKKADDHRASAGQYLLQAREACDEDGFDAFREKFCPELGRTSVYEMLAIATGKKSVEEVRASSAERSKKYRARKKVELAVRDVTDSSSQFRHQHISRLGLGAGILFYPKITRDRSRWSNCRRHCHAAA